jgi:hypothetical protein
LHKERTKTLRALQDSKHYAREDGVVLQSGFEEGIPQQIREIFDKFHDDAGNLCESIILFAYDLYRADSFASVSVAIAHLVKHLFKKNVSFYISMLVDYAKALFGQDVAELQAGLFGEETVDSLHAFFNKADMVTGSKVWLKLQDFIAYVGCFFLQLLPDTDEASERFAHLKHMVVDRKLEPSGNLVYNICRTLVYLLRQGYQSVKAGNPLVFFYTESSLVKWQTRVEEMEIKYANLNSVDPTTKVDVSDVLRDLDELIAKGI